MTLEVAILADDLTGALDAAAPFAARGWSTVAVLSPDGLPAALATGAEIVAVNTATRALDPVEAAPMVAKAASALERAKPRIAFKKLDSRLKGNVAAETGAALAGFDRATGLVVPAIPDLRRIVAGGALQGFGVAEPIAVAARFGDLASRLDIPDVADREDLAHIASAWLADAPISLAIGARGLAEALAIALRPEAAASNSPVSLPVPIVFAVASRDPITREQLTHLRERLDGEDRRAPNGAVPAEPLDLAAALHLVAAVEGDGESQAQATAARFAQGVRALVAGRPVGTLVLSGGDTALAVLEALDVPHLRVGGEAAPGIPWSTATLDGREVTILTKSGGFGDPLALAALADRVHRSDLDNRTDFRRGARLLGMGG